MNEQMPNQAPTQAPENSPQQPMQTQLRPVAKRSASGWKVISAISLVLLLVALGGGAWLYTQYDDVVKQKDELVGENGRLIDLAEKMQSAPTEEFNYLLRNTAEEAIVYKIDQDGTETEFTRIENQLDGFNLIGRVGNRLILLQKFGAEGNSLVITYVNVDTAEISHPDLTEAAGVSGRAMSWAPVIYNSSNTKIALVIGDERTSEETEFTEFFAQKLVIYDLFSDTYEEVVSLGKDQYLVPPTDDLFLQQSNIWWLDDYRLQYYAFDEEGEHIGNAVTVELE